MDECNEALRLVSLMDYEMAFEVLHRIAEKYPKILIRCDSDVFDEEWGIAEAIKQNSAFAVGVR